MKNEEVVDELTSYKLTSLHLCGKLINRKLIHDCRLPIHDLRSQNNQL